MLYRILCHILFAIIGPRIHIAHIYILNILKHCFCPNTVAKYLHTTAVYSTLSYLYLDSKQAKSNHNLINKIIIYRCHKPQLWLQQLLYKLSLFLCLKASILFSHDSTETFLVSFIQNVPTRIFFIIFSSYFFFFFFMYS